MIIWESHISHPYHSYFPFLPGLPLLLWNHPTKMSNLYCPYIHCSMATLPVTGPLKKIESFPHPNPHQKPSVLDSYTSAAVSQLLRVPFNDFLLRQFLFFLFIFFFRWGGVGVKERGYLLLAQTSAWSPVAAQSMNNINMTLGHSIDQWH